MVNTKRKNLSPGKKLKILQESDFICIYCGGDADQVDHIIPYSYSQNNHKDNLIAACGECNRIASDMVFDSLVHKILFVLRTRKARGLTPIISGIRIEPQAPEKPTVPKKKKLPKPPKPKVVKEKGTFGSPKALTRLFIYFKGSSRSDSFAFKKISEKLKYNWTHNHIYQVYTGRIPASKKFKGCITRLDQKTFKEKRHWLNIHALTLEQKERWKEIPMDKRRKALDIMFLKVRKDITCEHGCAFVNPFGWVPKDGCPIHDQLEEEKEK